MLLTTTQAAERLGVSPQRVRQAIKERKLKATQYGPRMYLIDEKAVDAYRKQYPQRTPARPAKGN